MTVHLIVDADVCIGSGECVAEDPEAIELDDTGCARVLIAELEEERAGQHLRRVPGWRALDQALSAPRP